MNSALTHIVQFLMDTGEIIMAKSLLSIISKYADTLETHDDVANCYRIIKDYHKSIDHAKKCLILASTNEALYNTRLNLAKLHNLINDPNQALIYLNANEQLNPHDPDVLLEKALSLFMLNKKEESKQLLIRTLSIDGISDNVRECIDFNLGVHDFKDGNLQSGLRRFLLTGQKFNSWRSANLPFKFWEGGIKIGSNIVILAEGGIGDEFINIRFLYTLRNCGMEPIWLSSRQDIVKIVKRLGFQATTKINDIHHNYDTLWTYSMRLPLYLDLLEKDLWKDQYIFPDPILVEHWKWIKNQTNNTKIGIRWSGNPLYEHDLHRSIPLEKMAGVIDSVSKHIQMFSLQKEPKTSIEQNWLTHYDIMDLSDRIMNFDDTLAIIENLDIVVTSCTSVAHAAAAMNKKTYILVPITAYYTWASTTDTTSVWYSDNVKVLRQVTHNCWDEPLEQLKHFLLEELK